jgi:hypothetical protein
LCVKRELRPADTKDLGDIPHYWPQAQTFQLPAVQYTARDVRSGLLFWAFAQHRSPSASAVLPPAFSSISNAVGFACAKDSAAQQMRLEQRLSSIRHRIDQAYLDKLDGKISEEFWLAKHAEWQEEADGVALALSALQTASPDRLLTAHRILELANRAYSLYLRQNASEQGKLLRMVLSNCATDGTSLYPQYRKPFDLIFQRAKTEEWRARRDSNLSRLAGVSEAGARS